MMLIRLSLKDSSNSLALILISLDLIYFAQGRSYYGSPDEFSSMGDVDWGKRGGISSIMGKRNVGAVMRSYRSPSYKRYDSPAWAYSSMADTDWGWRKRSDDSASAAQELYNIYKNNHLTNDYWKRFGQTYYQPYTNRNNYYGNTFQPSYTAHDTYGPRSSALSAGPKSESKLKSKDKYAFHSMADMDWGWKRKRSMSPPLVAAYSAESDKRADEEVNEDTADDIPTAKKNLASVAREFYAKRLQRSGGVAALARHGINTNDGFQYF